MAEDIDKLIERMEAEAKEADSFGMMNATTFSAAAHALQSLRSRVSELEAERENLRGAIRAIQTATVEGRVCDDVAWFSSIETLHDFCASVLEHSADQFDLLAASPTPPAAEAVGGALAETTAETGATVAPDSVDPTGLKDHLRALRNANEGFALVVWRASADGETGWDILSPKAAKEAESTLGWLMSIPGDVLMQSIPSIGTNGWLHAGEELQRERGAVAGRDGKSVSCALNAASTASDDLVTEIGQSMDVQYAIGSIINNEGSFFTGRGERMDRLVRAVLSSPPVREMVEALQMLSEISATHEDRAFARSILSRFQSVGGEKHDHADGASAEAVEKVTQPK